MHVTIFSMAEIPPGLKFYISYTLLLNSPLLMYALASHCSDNWCALIILQGQELWIQATRMADTVVD